MKTVLITGASRGIGKATAYKFASKGYNICMTCNKTYETLQIIANDIRDTYGVVCVAYKCNVADADEVKKMFADIYDRNMEIDVLVNNAAVSYIMPFDMMEDEIWNDIISTNLSGAFYCSKESMRCMLPNKSGKIINISSMWGVVGASCEVAYSASKAGLNGFTKALAKELAPSNIQVNAIAFGVIDTDMNKNLSEQDKKDLIDEIPANYIATAEQAAMFIYDIACTSNYMTGQIINYDGGMI